jgi:hypothetical protein
VAGVAAGAGVAVVARLAAERVVAALAGNATIDCTSIVAPWLQASGPVQGSPSLHATVLATMVQPIAGSQASSVQGLPSLHAIALP